MPYHIDEENSELAFEVREGNKLVIKIKSNIFSDSLELYLIKVGDNTEPTDKNVFSSLRVLKEIENLHDTILKEINSVTSGFWELKQDSQGNEYIATKYNVLTEGGLTTYGLGEQKLGTIYYGLPIDNDTIYWEEVEGSRVLKAKGSGGEAGSVQWGNISGKPTWIGETKPTYNWSEIQGEKPFYTKEEVAAKFVTIDTEQEITALKHFTAGLSVGESKKKIYEENGVVYIDADVAVTGAMTFYATAGRTVSTIMDAVTVDGITIKKENNVLKAVSGAGSSFDENAMWSALSGSSDNQINKSHLTTALDGYATQNWVIENYATKSELSAVSNKLNDFLEGSDTDTIINKWKELEAFLSGMAETDNLAEILETKADRRYVDSTFVTLATKQTITGEKTFFSVLNTAAIKASGAITAPSLAVSDYVTIAGIKLRKLEDGVITLEGNLAVTGGVTMYAVDPVSASTIMDGVVVDGTTIKKENGKLVAVGGGEAGSVAWGNITGKPSVFATNIANITDLHSSWDSVLAAQKPAWLTAVSIATISDLHANWDALLKAAPSAYVTRWPTISEVTNKQNLVVKLNGGTTEGTNQFTYNATGAKTINITPAGIGAYTKSESDSKYPTKTGSGASGTWSIGITGNAVSASKLQTARTLWGRSFDGTGNVSGNLDNVGNINTIGGTINAKVFAYNPSDSHDGLPWYGMAHYGNNVIAISGYGGIELFTSAGNALTIRTDNKVYANSYVASNWFRSIGDTGWYSEKWGGGWYMSDSTFLRSVNEKSVYIGNGSYRNAGGGYAANNINNASEVFNCRFMSEGVAGIPAGNIRNILGWYDSAASGWTTSYIIGSKREVNNDWGELMLGVYQYEDAKRSVAVYMGLDGAGGRVYIGGNLLVTGGVTLYGSDIRYKSIMHQVNLSLMEIAKAPSFVYHWNKEGMKCDRLNLGGSAQYTQSVLPWAVEENDNFLSMDYATVAYTFAVHTARHLLTYESRTDKKIKKLEREIVILKKQLKKLGYEEVRTLDDSGI